MNILWASPYSASSGYSIQSRLFVPRIKAMGHDIRVLEIGNQYRNPYEVNGVKVYPCYHDPMCNDVVSAYVAKYDIDAVITFMDVWKFDKHIWGKFPTFPWCPIDHKPVPPMVNDFLQGVHRPIAMSRFGEAEMRAQGLDPLYMPCAIDPAIFHPQDQALCRKALGIDPDCFLAVFVGVNDSVPSRKGIPELLAAWKMFVSEHPDAKLYLHTLIAGNLPLGATSGVRIDTLLNEFDIPRDSIYVPNQDTLRMYIPPQQIAQLYNAADVLLQPSRGEGFSVPLVEAQACGTPCIATNFSAQADHLHVGWKIEGEMEFTWQNAFWIKPGILAIAEALDAAYAERGNQELRTAAFEAAKRYHIDTVFEDYAKPVLQAIGEDVLHAYANSATSRQRTHHTA